MSKHFTPPSLPMLEQAIKHAAADMYSPLVDKYRVSLKWYQRWPIFRWFWQRRVKAFERAWKSYEPPPPITHFLGVELSRIERRDEWPDVIE